MVRRQKRPRDGDLATRAGEAPAHASAGSGRAKGEDDSESAAVKSARRVIELLEAFAEHRRPMRAGELAEALGMPQSSMSMLLKTLVSLGYLAFDAEDRTLRPTFRVTLLGSWLGEEYPVEGRIFEMMEEICRITGESVILGTERGVYVQYIHVVQSPRELRLALKPGTRRLLPSANLGLVLLSERSDAEVARIVERINTQHGQDAKPIDQRALLGTVAKVRRDGYSFSTDMVVSGASVIAFPLPLPSHQPRLALGIGGPTPRMIESRDALIAEMRRAIDKYMGGQ